MAESAKEVKNLQADIDGLEQVFEADYEPIEADTLKIATRAYQGGNQGGYYSSSTSTGLSIKAACIHYQMSASTLRKKIRSGDIPAEKIEGINGPEWRVFATGSGFDKGHNYGSNKGDYQGEKTLVTQHHESAGISHTPLLELIREQATKLEAAAGQIGYLSAENKSYQKQVLLLPDLESEAKRAQDQDKELQELKAELDRLKGSWWYRFTRFLSGGK